MSDDAPNREPSGLLALDLATVFGHAFWRAGDPVRSGAVRLPKTGSDVGRFLEAYSDWLYPFLIMERPRFVAFEAPILRSGKTAIDTARKLMCLAGMTEYICRSAKVPRYFEAHQQSVRKHFCGVGRGGTTPELKRRTIEACHARGWRPADDNEADALACLDYAAHCLRLDVPWACGALFATGGAR